MADELDPKKYHVLSQKNKTFFIVGAAVFSLVVLPALIYVYYNIAVNRPSQIGKELTFEIEKGQGISAISRNLASVGAVNSEFLFKSYVVLNELDTNIQAGIYTIKAGSNVKDIAALFQHGTLDTSITFVEGWRIEEFARKATSVFGNVDYTTFVKEASESEGLLFPDTYVFSSNVTTSEVVDHLEEMFNKKADSVVTPYALEKIGLTKDQVLSLASIIERETRDDADRAIVAGILIKRWKEGMKLEVDATTQYVAAPLRFGCKLTNIDVCPSEGIAKDINWWPHDLTLAELAIDSPINTRKNLGIPAKPISSFGLSALKAVLEYAPSDYYFYINDSTGKTHFAKTLKEHEANIKQYLTISQ